MSESFEQLSSLDRFRLEVAELKLQEEKEGQSVHFLGLSPEKLTEADMIIYNKFKDGTLDLAEFREYRNSVCIEGGNSDSCEFAAFLGNQFDYWMSRMSR